MKITLHDRPSISDPTEADIEVLLAGLSDAGEFIILSDERVGEVRAAGPQSGTFLLQCDLLRDGHVFRGERSEVGLAETASILREFLAGHVQWSEQFASREAPTRRIVAALVILGLALASLVWWLRRAA